ncbi:Uncharacterized protein OBRU01_01216 [Operophtera brumata]|uniref:Uncharacterized protein n=1 Tax=Operophtera brumata TaxID=104452 RepID=A0A0L7LUB7_OPEBR|nr:Uncharacterized protein OBRU01_01216 [Operophtera brumata]
MQSLFTRQRSASLSDANDKTQRNNNNTTIVENEQNRLYNPSAPWQRVPNQKRNRSPDESITNQAKRTQRREKIINKHRGIDNLEHSDTPEIEISNSFSLLGEESGDAQAKKTPKPPPIILYGVDDLAKLTQLIEEVVQTDDYTYKVVSKNQLIISSKTVDKYKTLIEHIRSKGLIGHTFTRKDQKCMRIVIKHLHFKWGAFAEYLEEKVELRISLKTEEDIDEATFYITNLIQVAAWRATPSLSCSSQRNNIPLEIRNKLAEKRKQRRKLHSSRSGSDRTEYNRISRELKELITENQNITCQQKLSTLTENIIKSIDTLASTYLYPVACEVDDDERN